VTMRRHSNDRKRSGLISRSVATLASVRFRELHQALGTARLGAIQTSDGLPANFGKPPFGAFIMGLNRPEAEVQSVEGFAPLDGSERRLRGQRRALFEGWILCRSTGAKKLNR
jgi:hypothetical protein